MFSPIFLVGCGRSGTTLLKELLNQSNELHILKESAFIPILYLKKNKYGDFTEETQRSEFIFDLKSTSRTSKEVAFEIFSLTEEKALSLLEKNAPLKYSEAISTLFSHVAKANGKEVWGDKTPLYVNHINLLHTLFPKAKIIHLIRDPRDVASSIRKAGWSSTIREAAFIWKRNVSNGLEGRKLNSEAYYEISYEKLILNTDTELKKLFEWLNFKYSKNILDQYIKSYINIEETYSDLHPLIGKPIDTKRAGNWKKKLTPQEIAEVQSINKDLINRLNLELWDVKVSFFRKIVIPFEDSFQFLKRLIKKILK